MRHEPSHTKFSKQFLLIYILLTRCVFCEKSAIGFLRGVTVFFDVGKIEVGFFRGVTDSFFLCSDYRPLSSNVRGFRSNQIISDIDNIHTDLVIESFDRRNQNIDKKTKSVNLY